jgi:biopolymer transport protein ExbB/TolQ
VSYFQLIAQGDAISRLVALLLLGMSVASWVVILWKIWLLPRARDRCRAQRGGVLAITVAGRCPAALVRI